MSKQISIKPFVYRGNPATLGQRFEEWLEMFDMAAKVDAVKAENTKEYLLLNIGEELMGVVRAKRKGLTDSYEDTRKMLTEHVKPQVVQFTEVMAFRRAKRTKGESAVEFATRLRTLTKYCGFDGNMEKEILQQFVAGIDRPEVERKCCADKDMTLTKAIELANTLENLDANVKGLHTATEREQRHGVAHITQENDESVNAWRQDQRRDPPRRDDKDNHRQSQRSYPNGHGHQGQSHQARHQQSASCPGCGKPRHEKRAEECNAWGKACSKCHTLNHFASVCRQGLVAQQPGASKPPQRSSKPQAGPPGRTNINNINSINNDHQTSKNGKIEVDAADYAEFVRYKQTTEWYTVAAVRKASIHRLNDGPRRTFHVNGRDVNCLVDTGAPVNVIDEETAETMDPKPQLAPCSTKFFPYGEEIKTPIPIIGQFTARAWYNGKDCQAGFVVVRGKGECLMSYHTAVALGIVTMDNSSTVSSVSTKAPKQAVKAPVFPPPNSGNMYSKEELKHMFPSLFSGNLGCLKDVKVHLDLDPEVKPVRQKLRPLPFHLREAVSKELKKHIDMGILERVTDDMGPTPWVSNIVPVLKDKDVRKGSDGKPSSSPPEVRITVDNRCQNKAIRRTHYPTKSIEDLLYEANGAKWFSKLDIIKAFHQFELDETQRYLTTIVTHEGLLRYTRLHMGISCASEVFSEHIRRLLEGTAGQINMTDDVLIHGATEEEHQQALLATLKKLEDAGLTLNLEKCEFYRDEVQFYGLRFSKDGVSPTEERVKALKECKTPTDAKLLRSFLCTVLWSARFMKDVNSIADPLWHLCKSGVPWQWTKIEETAFQAIKDAISTKCMGYFRKDWQTELISDASPVGLGGVLCQFNPEDPTQRHIICLFSRLLTEVERRYSQAEKEALGVVWLCERAQIYLIGHQFRIVVDNRAVQLIYGNTKSKPPARIERWALRLTPFDFEIVHRPGISNMADYYSRSPGGAGHSEYLEELKTEQHISMVTQAALPPAMTIQEVAEATSQDPELKELRKHIVNATKPPDSLKPYRRMFHELSVTTEGIILRDTRIVIPKSLRIRTVELAHGGHQGIVKTKRLIRSRVWFQGIDDMVEQHVKLCLACQANSDHQSYEPLMPSKMPERPWQKLSGDFFGPTPGGWYWFVNIDDHSNWAAVDKISSPSEDQVEPVLNRLFSMFGAPEVYKSDNRSPFQSHRFSEFAKKWGFRHRKVTPEWPRANGKAESFMKKLGKVLKTAEVEGSDEQEALQEFLRRYRETPHSSTGVSPNHLLLGFSRSSGIPCMLPETAEQREKWRKQALENDARAKARAQEEYDRRMHAKEPILYVGSQVLFKLKRHNKSSSAWDSDPYTVTAVNGSMITATRRDKTVTRNSSSFKLYRQVDFHLPEKPTSGQSSPERREEAPLEERATQASQVTVVDATTTTYSNEDVPSSDSMQPASSDTNQAKQPGTSQAEPKPGSKGRGRPTKEESERIRKERLEAQAAKEAAQPDLRRSNRNRQPLPQF